MKVELIHPPHYNSTDDRLDPPLGLLTIAAYLRHFQRLEVKVNDLSAIQEKDWEIGYADLYGVTVYVTSLPEMKKIVKKCKDKNPKSKIAIGGAHPSAVPESPEFTQNELIDYIVVGEGEEPMLKIVSNLVPKRGVISYETKSYFLFPAFDLIDINSYHRKICGESSLPMLTTRGCPFKCAFCGLKRMHELNKISYASPETIEEQLRKIKQEYGIRYINFQDDMFTLNHKRLFRLLDLIKPLGIKFKCHGRAGYDTEEVYARLADAGCTMVSWGIESGSDYILDKMNKKVSALENFQVIQWAKKYNIVSRAFFVIGFPGETESTLEETKNFIIEADPDQYFVSSFVPYPGTDVWNDPQKYGVKKISKDWRQFYQVSKDGTGGLTVDTEWLSREEFRKLELGFRKWIKKNKPLRGNTLDYEKKLYET